MINTVRQVSAGTSITGGAAAAGIKATEQYRDGSFLGWLDGHAVVIGLVIAFAGLLVQVAAAIVKLRSARSARLISERKKPAPCEDAGDSKSETF